MKAIIEYLKCDRGGFAVEDVLLTALVGGMIYAVLTSDMIKDADEDLWKGLFNSAGSKASF